MPDATAKAISQFKPTTRTAIYSAMNTIAPAGNKKIKTSGVASSPLVEDRQIGWNSGERREPSLAASPILIRRPDRGTEPDSERHNRTVTIEILENQGVLELDECSELVEQHDQ